MRPPHSTPGLVLALLALAASGAWAQTATPLGASLSTAPGLETNGFKFADGRAHAYLDLESRYDSAAGFIVNPATAQTVIFAELVEHLRPGLKLELPWDFLDYTLLANADYVIYPGFLYKGDQQFTHFESQVQMDAVVNRGGTTELDVSESFVRSPTTHDVALPLGVLSNYNDVEIATPIHPGGRALELTPRAGFEVEYFFPFGPAITNPRYADYGNPEVGLGARWLFLPKTAVVFDSRMDFRNYLFGGSPSAELLRVQGGLAGLLTTKISVVAKVGWGTDFGASKVSTVIGQGEARYLISETSTLVAGVLRSIEPVSLYGTVVDTRPYLEGRTLWNGRLSLHGQFNFDMLDFILPVNGTSRSDSLIGLDFGPEYQFAPWLIGAAGYVLAIRTSSQRNGSLLNGTPFVDNYTRHEAYVRLTLTY